MTVSPDAPPLAFKDLADAIRALRKSGLRLSTARRLVLQALFAAEGPVSAAHLARTLSVEESSVYRNLEVLEHHGLIRHVHLGHSPGLYVLVGEEEVEYLYCEKCDKVTAVPPDRLDPVRERIKQELGYGARFTHFAIVGVCDECAAEVRAAASAGHDDSSGSDPYALPGEPGAERNREQTPRHEHLHSHGDHVHSHPHPHPGGSRHTH